MALFLPTLCALFMWANDVSSHDAATATELAPVWRWPTSVEVEWGTVVGQDATLGLLVATRDGRLHLLDAARGTPRWFSLRVPTGVRPALDGHPVPGETAYVFDSATIHALNLRSPDAVRWRFGGETANPQDYPADPEFLAQWIAVAAGREAVLAIGTNGRLICLSAENGELRWTLELEPLSLARLRVCGKHAAVVWKAAGCVRAIFVTTTNASPSPRATKLGNAWPVWTEWTPAGLTCVAGGRVTVLPLSGPPRTFDTGLRWVSGSAVGVLSTGVSSSEVKSSVLLIGHGPHVSAYDLTTGERTWASWKLPDANRLGGNIHRLELMDRSVVCVTTDEVVVRDARSGVMQAALQLPGPILAADWSQQRLQALHAAEKDTRTLMLVRLRGTSKTWSIRRSAGARGTPQIVWIDGGFVLVEAGELRAFRLR